MKRKLGSLRATAKALGVAVSQLSVESKRAGFPSHLNEGRRVFDPVEVADWRRHNIHQRLSDTPAPAPASPPPAPATVGWRAALAVEVAYLQAGGALEARAIFGDMAARLSADDLDSLARRMTFAVCELACAAAAELFGAAAIPARAGASVYGLLLDHIGDRAIAQALADAAWRWAQARFSDNPEWRAFFDEVNSEPKGKSR